MFQVVCGESYNRVVPVTPLSTRLNASKAASSSVLVHHKHVLLDEPGLHSKVFCHSRRDINRRLHDCLLFHGLHQLLLLQLLCHFLFFSVLDHDFFVAFDAIKSGDFFQTVSLLDDFEDCRVRHLHHVFHPNDVLGRLVALVADFTPTIGRGSVRDLHFGGENRRLNLRYASIIPLL